MLKNYINNTLLNRYLEGVKDMVYKDAMSEFGSDDVIQYGPNDKLHRDMFQHMFRYNVLTDYKNDVLPALNPKDDKAFDAIFYSILISQEHLYDSSEDFLNVQKRRFGPYTVFTSINEEDSMRGIGSIDIKCDDVDSMELVAKIARHIQNFSSYPIISSINIYLSKGNKIKI